MTETGRDGRTMCPFDHHTPEFARDYRMILDELRETAPLVWSDLYGGFWIATRHDLVRRLAMDSDGLTVAPGPDHKGGIKVPPPPGADRRPLFVPGEADGEEHDWYRVALNPQFSKQKVASMTPMIERHVATAVDRVADLDEFDVVTDLVGPILSGVACEHLGLEVADPAGFFAAIFQMVSYSAALGRELDDVTESFQAAWALIVDAVAARREQPRPDVISHLTRWTTPRFTDEQIHMMTLNVILGSSDTTKSLLSQIFLYIDGHAEIRRHLRDHPEDIRRGVDEFLRLLVVAMGPARTATRDIEIEGLVIRAGERLILSFPAANHDPRRYPDPDRFDLDRGAGQHLAMGYGTHFCLGAWLAKSIAAITIREVLRRLPDYTIDTDRVVEAQDKNSLNAFVSVPARTGRTAVGTPRRPRTTDVRPAGRAPA